jgi:hypothetical protein
MVAEMCIEFTKGCWEVKNALCRGTRRCFARVDQDGPLESVAFLDTWEACTGETGKHAAHFAPQQDICLRFSGDKRAAPKTTANESPAAACSSPEQSPAPATRHYGDGVELPDSTPGDAAVEESFASVLSDFFDFFECGSNGQMDTDLVAPTLQALDLEDHVHVVSGFIQQ